MRTGLAESKARRHSKPMAERPEIWMVCQDGWPIVRGLPKAKAEAHAHSLKTGLDSHRGGSKIRSVDITIQRDREAERKRDDLYVEFKGYRNGGNLTKTHTQWAIH